MTDMHCHLIYGVDDGCRNIDESIDLIQRMHEVGFDNIIITPHYIEGTEYSATNGEKLTKLEVLREELKKRGIKVNLYLGNEIFINDHIPTCIEEGSAYSLNNGKYILFELPFHNQILGLSDIVHEMRIAGYIPILAHPERYHYFHDNYDLVDNLKEEGLLFQCNYASILGYYNRESEKLMKYMLKHQYVEYLGTDIHRMDKTYTVDNFKKIIKHIKRITGDDYFNEIMENCDNLIK